jgi:hypothetical protein
MYSGYPHSLRKNKIDIPPVLMTWKFDRAIPGLGNGRLEVRGDEVHGRGSMTFVNSTRDWQP